MQIRFNIPPPSPNNMKISLSAGSEPNRVFIHALGACVFVHMCLDKCIYNISVLCMQVYIYLRVCMLFFCVRIVCHQTMCVCGVRLHV